MNSLTSTLDGSEWSTLRPGRFTPREIAPGTHWIGGWVGPRPLKNVNGSCDCMFAVTKHGIYPTTVQ
jgi:hypothetical protein